MRLQRITDSNDPLLLPFPVFYETTFPYEERTGINHLLTLIDTHKTMHFEVILKEEKFAGIAVWWDLGICHYLLYLATLPEMRNDRLGAKTLDMLKSRTELPILGEVELPTDEMKVRRIGFYKRNGFDIVDKDPTILNEEHRYNLKLMLISSRLIEYTEDYQRLIVDKVYVALDDQVPFLNQSSDLCTGD